MTKLTNEELLNRLQNSGGTALSAYQPIIKETRAEILKRMAEGAAGEASQGDYFWPEGGLKWGHPIDVGHLILQLQTLDPKMKVSSVAFIDMADGRKARAFGLSMSRERWNEAGWLNFTLPGPECLAIWASIRQEINGLAPIESGSASTAGPRCPKCGGVYCQLVPMRKVPGDTISYQDDGWTKGVECLTCNHRGLKAEFFAAAPAEDTKEKDPATRKFKEK